MELGVDLLQRDLLIDIVIYRILNQFVHLWLFQINSFARKKKKNSLSYRLWVHEAQS